MSVIKLAYLKVDILKNLAIAMDALSQGKISLAIELTENALNQLKEYEKILKEVK